MPPDDEPEEGAGAKAHGDMPNAEGLYGQVRSVLDEAAELEDLLRRSLDRFETEAAVVDLPARDVMAVGDLHGHLGATLWVAARFRKEPQVQLVCLGDYVDRGPHQLETLVALLLLKEGRPGSVTLLRGNHESGLFTKGYGFRGEVLSGFGEPVYELALDTFSHMPLAAHRDDGVLLLHGGIPSGVADLDGLRGTPKGGRDLEDARALEVLMNDPVDRPGRFSMNMMRGLGNVYGLDATRDFMTASGLWLLVRAHEAVPTGHARVQGGRVLSIFSHPGYGGTAVRGAVAFIGLGREVTMETIEAETG